MSCSLFYATSCKTCFSLTNTVYGLLDKFPSDFVEAVSTSSVGADGTSPFLIVDPLSS